MVPLRRSGVNKGRSAGSFRRNVRRMKAANIAVMRGGWRL